MAGRDRDKGGRAGRVGACMIVGGNERNPLLFCLSLVSERLFCFLLGFYFALFFRAFSLGKWFPSPLHTVTREPFVPGAKQCSCVSDINSLCKVFCFLPPCHGWHEV